MAHKPVLSPQQQLAFNNALLSGIQDKDMDVIRLALDNGAEPNLLMFAGLDYKATWKDEFNSSAGADGFSLRWLKMAVEAGADVKATKHGGGDKDWQAIFWADYNFNRRTLDYLIDKGVPVDTLNPFGNTALMMAVLDGNEKKTRYYLSMGADPMAPCGENKDTFPLKALQASDKFKKSVKTQLLTLMMKSVKARTEEAEAAAEKAAAAEAEAKKPESAVVLSHDMAVSTLIELKHIEPQKAAKSFSL